MNVSIQTLLFGGAIFSAGIAPAQVSNGSFESGDFAGWSVSDIPYPYEPMSVTPIDTFHAIGNFGAYFGGQVPFSDTSPTDGSYAFWTGFDGSAGIGSIVQDVLVNRPLLRFEYRAAWVLSPFGATQDRAFRVVVREAGGGSVLATFPQLTVEAGTDQVDTGSIAATVDLSAFAGQTVQLAFEWDVPESLTGPAGFQLDNVRLEGLNVVPVMFGDIGDFGCGGDRFSPVTGSYSYCDYLYNGNYPDTTCYLRAGRDYCFNRYDGTYLLLGTPDPMVFSRSAGTSGGLVDAQASADGIVQNGFRSGNGAFRTRVEFSVSAYVNVPDIEDPCGYAYGGYGSYSARADASADIELHFSEPMRLVARDASNRILSGYQIGDVVPEGEHSFSTSYVSAFASNYGGGVVNNSEDLWADFEYTDCDGNGVNDLREVDSDGNGVTDACEPIQNITQGTGFGTIQSAVDASTTGDVVHIEPGLYSGLVNFAGKQITLRGVGGPDATILDSGGPGPVVTFENGEGRGSVLEGVTVTGATADQFAGIAVIASPTIRDCVIRDNAGSFGGGAKVIGSPRFERVLFLNNTASQNGGAADDDFGGSAEYIDCVFAGNAAGSSGGAVLAFESTPTFINCTFFGNSAANGGAIASWNAGGGAAFATVINSVFDNNTTDDIRAIGTGSFSVSYSVLAAGGATNLVGPPLFENTASGDYRLRGGSPGIDAADSAARDPALVIDAGGEPRYADDAGVNNTGSGPLEYLDAGAYEFQGTSPEPCLADIDQNGVLNLDDLDAFVAAFLGADLAADLDGNGILNLDDLDAFVTAFLAGCPG